MYYLFNNLIFCSFQIQGEEGVTTLSTDGPLRMITQGQELTIDYDERTLYDMGFKDNQVDTLYKQLLHYSVA